MALINSSGFAHVRITVTDIDRSKQFYDRVFGWPTAIDESYSGNEPGVTLFGLRPVGDDQFASTPTGLDHVSFAVSDRSALEDARKSLADAGIEHGEIIDLTNAGMAILSIQDPDDINIDLTAPLS